MGGDDGRGLRGEEGGRVGREEELGGGKGTTWRKRGTRSLGEMENGMESEEKVGAWRKR